MKKEEIQKDRRVNFHAVVIIFLIVILFGILILLQTKDSSYNPSSVPLIAKGLRAPNFSLPGLDGRMVSLTDYKGKVVLLNIWATWCPPCVEEMPSMEKLYQELQGEGFEILAVSIDESGAQDMLPFMKKHKLSFPALIDSKGTLKGLYQTTGVPESFIIDKDGILVEKVIGPRNWAIPEAIGFFRNLIRRD
ncbi:MAG: TlpA family protein disulfide reductase [Desulfobacterales bacterium]|nr:TlpA family protein disulfide reductase [Desulfobacterales bacterium]